MTDIERYADSSMFPAEPMRSVTPNVTLLQMTPDPLGAIAAACGMYEGKPTYDLADITDQERAHYWEQVQQTHLQAPLEFVDLHFFIEGVNRAFTHQMIRQRTAVYAQESMRFAVKGNLAEEAATPPSIRQAGGDILEQWESELLHIQDAYNHFVANGIPAEDARDILPHATTTRLHYKTNLRNLVEHAGNRLCTQAQFAWRIVFAGIVQEIRDYNKTVYQTNPLRKGSPTEDGMYFRSWQFETIANSALFRPVCYALGKCPFKADFDRGCTIRERVDKRARMGHASSDWGEDFGVDGRVSPAVPLIPAIRDEEWLLDPRAAWQ